MTDHNKRHASYQHGQKTYTRYEPKSAALGVMYKIPETSWRLPVKAVRQMKDNIFYTFDTGTMFSTGQPILIRRSVQSLSTQ